MSDETFWEMLFAVGLVCVGGLSLYYEPQLIKFEAKIKKIIKCFVKACYYTWLEKKQAKMPDNIVELSEKKNNAR